MKTSTSDPIRVDFIDLNGAGLAIAGRIGLTIAPGKKDTPRGWDRDLGADLSRLRGEYDAHVLGSLMEEHEYVMLHVPELKTRAAAAGLDVRWFPIVDVDVPKSERMNEFSDYVDGLVAVARDGKTVVIHCRGGIGRSGTVAACCLVRLGLKVHDAIKATRTARPGAVETSAQEKWVASFELHARTARPVEVENEHRIPRLGAFRGCLLGGAVGDALGYPIEFIKTAQIEKKFGTRAPKNLNFDGSELARISDDTQMTLFTAEGLIRAKQRGMDKGICHPPTVVAFALLRWFETQGRPSSPSVSERGWLVEERRLHSQRAPGNTCMSALETLSRKEMSDGIPSVDRPPNDSKGCGAVMRAAPCGLVADSRELAFEFGRDTGVMTHGHPSGYLSAAYFAALVWDLVRGVSLGDAMTHADALLAKERGNDELVRVLRDARKLALDGPPSASAIESIGGGWTGEEALAISILCALTYAPQEGSRFEETVWRAAAHSGDSDSTAAITGNLLGAMHGLRVIPPRWLNVLELRDVIDRVATDLYASAIQDEDLRDYPPN